MPEYILTRLKILGYLQSSNFNYLEVTGQKLTCSSCPVFIRTIENLISEAENAKLSGILELFNEKKCEGNLCFWQ